MTADPSVKTTRRAPKNRKWWLAHEKTIVTSVFMPTLIDLLAVGVKSRTDLHEKFQKKTRCSVDYARFRTWLSMTDLERLFTSSNVIRIATDKPASADTIPLPFPPGTKMPSDIPGQLGLNGHPISPTNIDGFGTPQREGAYEDEGDRGDDSFESDPPPVIGGAHASAVAGGDRPPVPVISYGTGPGETLF